jgi:hypothetical protein
LVTALQPVVGAAAQLPTVNSVPPRVRSSLVPTWLEKVWPRRPASTEPFVIAPLDANWLSLLTATLMVMVPAAVSNAPQSAAPRCV